MKPRIWTLAEKAVVRDRYASESPKVIAADLGRPVEAIFRMAKSLGVATRFRFWTDVEVRQLRNLWPDLTLGRVAARLGRSKSSIYLKAKEIGLPLGCLPGHESLTSAAKRTGYTLGQLREILKWAGVRVRPSMGRPQPGIRWHHHIVEPIDVDEAVAKWLSTEKIGQAARARHVSRKKLVARLRMLDALPPLAPPRRHHVRVPSELIDRALALPRARRAA